MKPVFTRSVREEILSVLWLIAGILAHMDGHLSLVVGFCAFKFLECSALAIFFAITGK